MADTVRIATRKSPLALWQAEHVAQQLQQAHPGLAVELVPMVTSGDRFLATPLSRIGGKGLFVKELEAAMLQGAADIAVHSIKDMPVSLPEGLILSTILQRHDPRDAFVSRKFSSIEALPEDALVGTSSLRRASQLRLRFPEFRIVDCRGNVNTRLKKLDDGEFDAILLAVAGLERLGLHERVNHPLEPEVSLPAIGQGAIGIECRADDEALQQLLVPLHHAPTARCVEAERAMNERLEGGCEVPIAGHARTEHNEIWLRALVASEDGARCFRAEARGSEPYALGLAVADDLLEQGAGSIIAHSRS